ncbi:hypothetical protein BMS3Bbin04_01146 [bacterium BMS3Bbin04]|nr:hypothetical protein BMS3Bbin04_01146 [bacterium BMS3Bbin04]
MKNIFEICTPRDDVLKGDVNKSDFAADLAQVLRGDSSKEYSDATVFFANTHPTEGLKALLFNVCRRLSKSGGEASSIFRLDTQYGGGKTHALIALSHAAKGIQNVPNVDEFIDPELLPTEPVHVAAFDGENADPLNGHYVGDGIRAFTPWGELAYALAGKKGYESLRKSDEERVAPGAETIRQLFDGQPALILLDELSIYLRKIHGQKEAGQLTPFLTGLFKAVESSPGVALVFTLAIGKEGKATDAYSEENLYVAKKIEEAEQVAARKATLLDPTAEHETAQVLRRRLFKSIDDDTAEEVVEQFQVLWSKYAEDLPTQGSGTNWRSEFRNGYPFHPALMTVLTDKLSTLNRFQRVRGMLRLLTRTVALMWKEMPKDTYAVQVHHLNPSDEQIRNEIVTRLGLKDFDPAMRNDIADRDSAALAQHIDKKEFGGMSAYGSFAARTILWHSFAFNEQLKGLSPEQLRWSILAPLLDLSFINKGQQIFTQQSAFLDDRPAVPLRIQTEPNLQRVIQKQEEQVDPGDEHAQLRDKIKDMFKQGPFELVPFPSGPYEVDDDIGSNKPRLAILSYDAETVEAEQVVPELVERIFSEKGSHNSYRDLKNFIVFVLAADKLVESMRQKMRRRLALESIVRSTERMNELAEHQQHKVRELHLRSETDLASAIQQCYRHLFYPSRGHRVPGSGVDIGHTAFDLAASSASPGRGQDEIVRSLKDNQKLLTDEQEPLAPNFVRDHTPLKNGHISTFDLRQEFRKDTSLPIMLGNMNFLSMVRKGVEDGKFVYVSGDLTFGPGDSPTVTIKIDQESFVYTIDEAKKLKIWPREPEPTPDPDPGDPTLPNADPPRDPVPNEPTPPSGVWTFNKEDILKAALSQLWESARAKEVEALGKITLRFLFTEDALKSVEAVSGIPGGKKTLELTGGYEVAGGPDAGGSDVAIEFSGRLEDGKAVRNFLRQQFQGLEVKELKMEYRLSFPDGLLTDEETAAIVTKKLSIAGLGATKVHLTAEATR